MSDRASSPILELAAHQSCRRPTSSRRLRLETFEERWTLGGGGYLDASLIYGGIAATSAMAMTESRLGASEATSQAHLNLAVSDIFTGVDSSTAIDEGSTYLLPVPTEEQYPAQPEPERTDAEDAPVRSANAVDDELLDNTRLIEYLDTADPEAYANYLSGASAGTSAGGITPPSDTVGQMTYASPVSDSANGNTATAGNSGNELADVISRLSSSINPGYTGFNGMRDVTVRFSTTTPELADPHGSLITSWNRNATTMTGGWNPALRSIMVMKDGSRWFAAEQGSNVYVNSVMVYYRLGKDGWSEAGSVVLPPGIQQNMASITDGRTIYSYGSARSSVIEATFDTANPGWNLHTGNSIWAGGRVIVPGANSNYIGAAIHKHTRVVWWTSVGTNGTGGSWNYSFNNGGGWNGPIVSGLGGYNDVGYVRAQFDDQSHLRLIGESYRGRYPFGAKYLSSATVKLGNAASWAPILQKAAYTPLDLWQGGSGDSTHFLYRTRSDLIGYAFGSRSTTNATTFTAHEARFIADQDRLALVLGYHDHLEIRVVPRSQATSAIDWNAIEPTEIPLPKSLHSNGLSAIWNSDVTKQPGASDKLEFAISGSYPSRDHLIYYYSID